MLINHVVFATILLFHLLSQYNVHYVQILQIVVLLASDVLYLVPDFVDGIKHVSYGQVCSSEASIVKAIFCPLLHNPSGLCSIFAIVEWSISPPCSPWKAISNPYCLIQLMQCCSKMWCFGVIRRGFSVYQKPLDQLVCFIDFVLWYWSGMGECYMNILKTFLEFVELLL